MNPSDSSENDRQVSPVTATGDFTVKLIDVQWLPRAGIKTADIKTYGYGFGTEYVYCYSFQTILELARLKQENHHGIKVGSAIGNPVDRIYQQCSGSKTALSEWPIVLLVFQTVAARHLERWIHKHLQRVPGSGGSEWFHTNLEELVDLFRTYLTEAIQSFGEPADLSISSEIEITSLAGSTSRERRGETRNQQGHRIQAAMKLGVPVSVLEIVKLTGLNQGRVVGHIEYEISKGRAMLDENGDVVVLEHPRYRTADTTPG